MSPKSAAQTLPVSAPAEDAFYISATQSVSRPRRTLKSNDTFVVVDTHGDIGASTGGADGLFSHDTRFLSQSRASGERRAAAAARLERARRQHAARRRSHQSGLLRRSARIVLQKDMLHDLAHDLSVARHGLPALRRCAITAIAPIDRAAGDSVRATTSPICSRCAACAARGAALPIVQLTRQRPSAAQLSRARRQAAPHHADLRSAAERAWRRNGAPTSFALAPGELRPIFLLIVPGATRQRTGPCRSCAR